MSEYLNDKAAKKAEELLKEDTECTCTPKGFVSNEHALSCPANILRRGKKKIGRLIRKK